MHCQGDTPEDNIRGEVFRNRNSLNDVIRRVLDDQNGQVDAGSQPAVLSNIVSKNRLKGCIPSSQQQRH